MITVRSIDADALLDGYKNMGYDPTEHPEESYMEGWCKGFNAAVDHCMHHVIHAPTIEPERKNGRWAEFDSDEDKSDIIKCPCCKHMFTVDSYHWTDIGFVKDDFNFCPNCGEDIRGEQNG